MNNEQKKDFIIDDIILNYIYNKEKDFTFEDLDNELAAFLEKNGVDYKIYSSIIPNAIVGLVSAGRFKIEKDKFICLDKNVRLSAEQKEHLIQIKEKAENKYIENNRGRKL